MAKLSNYLKETINTSLIDQISINHPEIDCSIADTLSFVE